MGTLKSVCVYCGSGLGTNPSYEEAARTLGRDLARSGVRLVFGGGSIGLMGIVSQAVLDAGGEVTGIIPKFLQNLEQPTHELTELVVTDDMHQRKMLMFERADAFVALPGGIGTLEELVEQMTWAQLGRHQKPVLIANIDRFWEPFISLLDAMRRDRFIRLELEVTCLVAKEAGDIVPMLKRAVAERAKAAPGKAAVAEPLSRM